MTELLRSMPLHAGFRWFAAFERDEPNAVACFRSEFPIGSECFLCAQPTDDDRARMFCSDDPRRAGYALISAICSKCMFRPARTRLELLRGILSAMFHTPAKDVRTVPHAALKRLG